MGRLTVKILILVALVWGGWWWLATSSLHRSVETYLDAQRDTGLQISGGGLTRSGFPLKIATTVDQMTLTDATVPATLDIPQLSLSSPIYWPGDATFRLPAEPVSMTTPQGKFVFTSDGVKAMIELHPGTTLQLEGVSAASSDLALDLPQGRALEMESLQAEIVQQDAAAETYDIRFAATGVVPSDMMRQSLQLPTDWKAALGPVLADMTVTFDRPWDRSALGLTRPQPRAIRIAQMTATWSDVGVLLQANLTVAPDGLASGKLRLNVQNWQKIFDIAAQSGMLTPDWRGTAEGMLRAMSDPRGALDLDITVDRGQMRLGFIPLGMAPPLIIR